MYGLSPLHVRGLPAGDIDLGSLLDLLQRLLEEGIELSHDSPIYFFVFLFDQVGGHVAGLIEVDVEDTDVGLLEQVHQ